MTTLAGTDPAKEHSKRDKYLDDPVSILILLRKVFPAVAQQKQLLKLTTALHLKKSFAIISFYVKPVIIV